MVDMVKTNVPGQPVKQSGKLIVGTASDGSNEVIPVFLPVFIGFFVLVLDIEKPKGDDPKENNQGRMNQENCFPAKDPNQTYIKEGHPDIVEQLLDMGFAPAFKVDQWHPVRKKDVDDRGKNKQHQWGPEMLLRYPIQPDLLQRTHPFPE